LLKKKWRRLIKLAEEYVAQGEGLSTPQQFVFELTARPGAFDLNGKQAEIENFDTGCLPCGSVGQS
jgi:hypothetical protein